MFNLITAFYAFWYENYAVFWPRHLGDQVVYRSPYKHEDSTSLAPTRPRHYFDLFTKEGNIGQSGLFTNEPILKGSVVAQDGGVIVTSIEDVYPSEKNYVVLIEEGLWLAPNEDEPMDPLFYLNHSCESNLARHGPLTYVAKKNIAAGEELFIDYAPLASDLKDWTLECECGSDKCRKTITSLDYLNPSIAAELWQEWLPYIQRKIAKFNYEIK